MAITAENLKDQFRQLDKTGDGFLNHAELAKFLTHGDTWTKAELDIIFNNVDTNHDGKIGYSEFVDFLMGGPPAHEAPPAVAPPAAQGVAKAKGKAKAGVAKAKPKPKAKAGPDVADVRELREIRLLIKDLEAVLSTVCPNQNDRDANKIKAFFKKADTSGDNSLTPLELSKYMKSTGSWTDAEITVMVKSIDKNSDKKISMNEFVDWFMAGGPGPKDVNEALAMVEKLREKITADTVSKIRVGRTLRVHQNLHYKDFDLKEGDEGKVLYVDSSGDAKVNWSNAGEQFLLVQEYSHVHVLPEP